MRRSPRPGSRARDRCGRLRARPARAPRSLRDVDVCLDAVGAACGTHELAQSLDHATATPDEPPHVVGVGVHEQRDLTAAAFLDLDLDRVGIVGEVPRDVLGDRARTSAHDPVALGTDFVLVVIVFVVVVEVFVAHVASSAGSAGASSAGASSAGASSAGASAASGSSAGASALAAGASTAGACTGGASAFGGSSF